MLLVILAASKSILGGLKNVWSPPVEWFLPQLVGLLFSFLPCFPSPDLSQVLLSPFSWLNWGWGKLGGGIILNWLVGYGGSCWALERQCLNREKLRMERQYKLWRGRWRRRGGRHRDSSGSRGLLSLLKKTSEIIWIHDSCSWELKSLVYITVALSQSYGTGTHMFST